MKFLFCINKGFGKVFLFLTISEKKNRNDGMRCKIEIKKPPPSKGTGRFARGTTLIAKKSFISRSILDNGLHRLSLLS